VKFHQDIQPMPPLTQVLHGNAIQPEAGPRQGRLQWLVPAVLLALYAAQCAWFIRTQSLTYDEPVHIAEGLNAWRDGRFEQYNDHPPLARLLCSLPLINRKWQIHVQPLEQGFRIDQITTDPEALAWRARSVIVLFGLVLGWLLWIAARRLFSTAAANFVLALFAFSPSVISQFSLATTDGAATLLTFATAFALVQWRIQRSWRSTVLFAAILGMLVLSKFSALPMFMLALVWTLLLGPTGIILNPRRWNWAKTISALLISGCVVWAGYFFHVSHLSVRDGNLTASFPNWREEINKHVQSRFNYSLPVPAGEYIEGLREVARHNARGQPAFFLGQVSSTGGWKLYYPVTILLKWPVTVLLVCVSGLALALRKPTSVPMDVWIMASFAVIYFGLAMHARFNLGERHVLPLYPFALMFAGHLWEYFHARRWQVFLLYGLVLLNAADALRFAPGYLSYFSPLVPQSQAYRLLSDSNLDWGQGLLALRKYEQTHPGELIWLAYFGSVDPAVYGIRAQPLAEGQRVTGTIIASTTNISGQFLRDPASYHWLLQYKPAGILDHSLLVFRVE
jgi:hypothetical protein